MSSEPRETSVRRVKPGAAITVGCAPYMFVNALSAGPEESAVRDAPQVDLNGADVRLGLCLRTAHNVILL